MHVFGEEPPPTLGVREPRRPRPQAPTTAAAAEPEGMVTVWDEHGRIVGCMGVELWRALLNAQAVAP